MPTEIKSELKYLMDTVREIREESKRLPLIEKDLSEHMRRTELLEKAFQSHSERFVPVEKHIAMFSGAVKAITVALASLGAVAGLVKVGMEFLKLH